jgi:uncharacterized membrane protein YfcA
MTDLDPLMLALLCVAGLAAGFINTMAGGGSLLTLPALMLVGLPADVANASNRVSVVSQSVSGVYLYAREGKLKRRAAMSVLLPTIGGSLVGALVASRAPTWLLQPVLLTTMVLVALLMALKPELAMGEADDLTRPMTPRGAAGLFAAGLYGGFIQAGVGFVLLAVLGGLLRYDLIRANALKLACTMVFGVVALGVFVLAGQVSWLPACVLALASVLGSQLGVRFALKMQQRVLRWIVLVSVICSCIAVVLKG